MSYRIHLVDDDKHYARLAAHRLGKHKDYTVETFPDGQSFFDHLDEVGEQPPSGPDAVLLDIMMPGMSGIEVLARLKERLPDLPVIMISAQGVVETAIQAMKKGAYDYVTKGKDDLPKLRSTLKHALDQAQMRRKIDALRDEVEERYGLGQIIGESEPMQEVYRLVRKAVRARIAVAVQGESGTGKELVSRAIHYGSSRKEGPFVEVNCAAVPSELMESTFFGHEKGAFTDAKQQRVGKFEQADGGTLFLDEVGAMNLDLQAKLLRALQNRTIQRVGGNETISFDARIICATNADARQLIKAGDLREDLYYRLFQFPITLPPLRERGKDVLLLARHFREAYLDSHPDLQERTFSSEALRTLTSYPWPGNVRELKSAVERALLIADSEQITPGDLLLKQAATPSADTREQPAADASEEGGRASETHKDVPSPGRWPMPLSVNGSSGGDGSPGDVPSTDGQQHEDEADIRTFEEMKRRAVARAYELCNENATAAAEELGIGRATMYRLLNKYDLKD